jgi:uncharacterized delta-60 repeat protein
MDGTILVGGPFTSIGGQARTGMARLNATTGAATSFNPNADSSVDAIVVQTDGKVLVGGVFFRIGGQFRRGIARLDPVTGVADSFNPNADALVASIAVQPDGKILVGGSFTSIGGQMRNRIARLDPATGLADSFNPNASANIFTLGLQADGKILVGGIFTSIGGQTRNYLARLDATTGAADSFNPNPDGEVYTIALQADGKILAGGFFNSAGGQMRNYIVRLNPVDGLADSFNPNAADGVIAITVAPDGKILAGGVFRNIGGQARISFARLSNDTAALQNLSVAQRDGYDTITWMRGGASPLLTRVFFDYAFDNTAFTLGPGVPSGSNWTLNISGFPTRRNFYVRGSGFYRGGEGDGSASITESVAHLYLSPRCAILSESFDGVTAPALPLGWVATNAAGAPPLWVTSTVSPDSAPNAALVDDPATISDKRLETPAVAIKSTTATLTFRHNYMLEDSYDGGVLEISSPNIDGGAFTDITNAAVGGSFVSGGYNGTINVGFGNPLAGRAAWTATSGGYITTIVALGPNVAGQWIKLRFRMGSDSSVEAVGWKVDTVSLTDVCVPTPSSVVSRMNHGASGPFSVNLPLSGPPGVECRTAGAANDYQIVFTFPSAVTFTGAALTSGVGTVSGTSGNGLSTVSVNLTGVTNAQRITVTLFDVSNASGTGDVSVPMGVLSGDTTGNGSVSASDIGQVKGQSGQPLGLENFRSDLNLSGSISASDIGLVKSRAGTALP